jgi:hypothetical protein
LLGEQTKDRVGTKIFVQNGAAMARGENLGTLGLFLLALAFVGTASGVACVGHLSSENIRVEIFAAAVGAALNVGVVGGVARWHQRRAHSREEKVATLRELEAIRQKVRDANFLMTAHKSAKTWTEQTRELVMLVPRITDLQETAVPNDPAPAKPSALARARDALRSIKKEYLESHDDVAKLGTHWDAILEAVPRSKELIVEERSQLLDALDESIDSLKQHLRR